MCTPPPFTVHLSYDASLLQRLINPNLHSIMTYHSQPSAPIVPPRIAPLPPGDMRRHVAARRLLLLGQPAPSSRPVTMPTGSPTHRVQEDGHQAQASPANAFHNGESRDAFTWRVLKPSCPLRTRENWKILLKSLTVMQYFS